MEKMMRFYVLGLYITENSYYIGHNYFSDKLQKKYTIKLQCVESNDIYHLTLFIKGNCDNCVHCNCKGQYGCGFLYNDINVKDITYKSVNDTIIKLHIDYDNFNNDISLDKFGEYKCNILDCNNIFFDFSVNGDSDISGYIDVHMDMFEEL